MLQHETNLEQAFLELRPCNSGLVRVAVELLKRTNKIMSPPRHVSLDVAA